MITPELVTFILGFATGLTGLVGVMIPNRRFKSERPVIVMDRLSGHRAGRQTVILRNVGLRVALDLLISCESDGPTVTETFSASRPGEELSILLPEGTFRSLFVSFQDVAGGARETARWIGLSGAPRLPRRDKPALWRRISDALTSTSSD